MLWEVRRVLAPAGGVYVIASVHGPDRLLPLLRSAALGFAEVEHYDLGAGEVGHHLHICRLPAGRSPVAAFPKASLSDGAFEDFVAEALDAKYTEVMPLVTPARVAAVVDAFAAMGRSAAPAQGRAAGSPSPAPSRHGCAEATLRHPAREVHAKAFTAKEVEEYPYTDFLEDLAHFLDARRGDPAVAHRPEQEEPLLSCDTFLEFLQSAQ